MRIVAIVEASVIWMTPPPPHFALHGNHDTIIGGVVAIVSQVM